jgi:hypothetical protein
MSDIPHQLQQLAEAAGDHLEAAERIADALSSLDGIDLDEIKDEHVRGVIARFLPKAQGLEPDRSPHQDLVDLCEGVVAYDLEQACE